MKFWSALALLLAIAGALFLRTLDLGNRPLHNDEATNATKLAVLWEKGEYKYDPHEFHGPTLYYFSLPFLKFSSAKDANQITYAQLRLVTVAFGVGLILLLTLLRDGLGRGATVWSALFLAVSPAMVFYSRYFIHEMLLVFFTLLVLVSGWRYARKPGVLWSVVTGLGLGLMFATKETFVLTLAAMGFALVATRIWNRWRATKSAAPAAEIPYTKWSPTTPHLAVTFGTVALIWLLLFSSFFTNWRGLLDSFLTFFTWFDRAKGASPHIQPWYFYFERLLWFHPAKSMPWTELLILVLALIGAAAGFCGNCARITRPSLVRFLTFYTFALTVIYTIISYKTPWCALNFWLGMILLAGIGASALVKACRHKLTQILMAGLIGAGVLHLAVQAWLLTREYPADLRNPYIYAQTSPHERKLVERIKAIARIAPEGFSTVMKIISPESYWPLPWEFREFKHVGWYDELPTDPYAPIVLCAAKLDAKLDDKSDKAYIMTGYYQLRPQVFLELYVERGLWEKFVATLPRDRD